MPSGYTTATFDCSACVSLFNGFALLKGMHRVAFTAKQPRATSSGLQASDANVGSRLASQSDHADFTQVKKGVLPHPRGERLQFLSCCVLRSQSPSLRMCLPWDSILVALGV